MALMSVWLMIACHQPVASSSRALFLCACMFVCALQVNYCTLHSYGTQPYTCVIELGNHLIASVGNEGTTTHSDTTARQGTDRIVC